eukprot:TRINITY_DN11260_c0_g1_i1.p1 TRINITY_DN11260_c0_g1~~TRINITY_DN11260_c0_g1_i1.p1  ORF type:complete len:388 (-),score=42.18 TRINITY_DN11260_c0_g1_i1:6-1043(-)
MKPTEEEWVAEVLSRVTPTGSLDIRSERFSSEKVEWFVHLLLEQSPPGLVSEGGSTEGDSHPLIRSLDLSHNHLLDPEGRKLLEVLKANRTITYLNLRENRLRSAGGTGCADLLNMSTVLTTLILANNHLTAPEANIIGEALKINKTLRLLDLSSNKIGGGAKNIVEALRCNSTLTSLSMPDNQLKAEVGLELAEVLLTNTTLTTLNLAYNLLEGSEAGLLEMLRRNKTLTTLNLLDNSMLWTSAKVAEALQSNCTLTTFMLDYDDAYGDAARIIADRLLFNSRLRTSLVQASNTLHVLWNRENSNELNKGLLEKDHLVMMCRHLHTFSDWEEPYSPSQVSTHRQ